MFWLHLCLTEAGKSLIRGESIQYIYTDWLIKIRSEGYESFSLVTEKSMIMTKQISLEASGKTGLGYFGFDRTVYGNTIRKKIRKWWYELEDER